MNFKQCNNQVNLADRICKIKFEVDIIKTSGQISQLNSFVMVMI